MKENIEAARDALGIIAAAVRGDGDGMGGIVFDGYLDGEQIDVDDVAQLIQGLAFVGISWLHEKHTLERYLDQARKATGFNGPWPHVQDIKSEEFREEILPEIQRLAANTWLHPEEFGEGAGAA
jgi:hypothetical protein